MLPYKEPVIEIIVLETADVITESNPTTKNYEIPYSDTNDE